MEEVIVSISRLKLGGYVLFRGDQSNQPAFACTTFQEAMGFVLRQFDEKLKLVEAGTDSFTRPVDG